MLSLHVNELFVTFGLCYQFFFSQIFLFITYLSLTPLYLCLFVCELVFLLIYATESAGLFVSMSVFISVAFYAQFLIVFHVFI